MGISHKIPCQTHCLPAKFLCNLPKNLTMHLTHKFCLVLPLLFFIDYGIIKERLATLHAICLQILMRRRFFHVFTSLTRMEQRTTYIIV